MPTPADRPLIVAVGLGLALGLLSGCGPTDGGRERVTVLAASSLTGVFEDVEAAYEAAHPDIDLVVSTGGSPTLAAQAAEGAPAALLITADDASMDRAVDAGVVSGETRPVATNRAVIAVPEDPPGPEVDDPTDLSENDLVVVLCAAEVPCGGSAVELFDDLDIDVEPDSLESNVQAVVARLRLGEADAGVVYRTDVTSSEGSLREIEDRAPESVATVRYVGGVLDAESGGADVLDFLTGPEGRTFLDGRGFGTP